VIFGDLIIGTLFGNLFSHLVKHRKHLLEPAPFILFGAFDSCKLGRSITDAFFYGHTLHAGSPDKTIDGDPLEKLLNISGRRYRSPMT
jgi:hypothetical protein